VSARSMFLIGGIASLVACTSKDEAVETTTTTAAPNVVSLTATEYSFRAPDTVPAGWTNFRLATRQT